LLTRHRPSQDDPLRVALVASGFHDCSRMPKNKAEHDTAWTLLVPEAQRYTPEDAKISLLKASCAARAATRRARADAVVRPTVLCDALRRPGA
jgi:hypothetical protein